MIVGTKINGKIATFDVDTNDYKVARNTVVQELGADCVLHTPFLAVIPGGGKARVTAHRVKDPLNGALAIVTAPVEEVVVTKTYDAVGIEFEGEGLS